MHKTQQTRHTNIDNLNMFPGKTAGATSQACGALRTKAGAVASVGSLGATAEPD